MLCCIFLCLLSLSLTSTPVFFQLNLWISSPPSFLFHADTIICSNVRGSFYMWFIMSKQYLSFSFILYSVTYARSSLPRLFRYSFFVFIFICSFKAFMFRHIQVIVSPQMQCLSLPITFQYHTILTFSYCFSSYTYPHLSLILCLSYFWSFVQFDGLTN